MADEKLSYVNFEEMFGMPIQDVPDELILEKVQELRTRRKYPSVDKAANKKTDKVQDLIQSVLVQVDANKKKGN